MAKLILWGILFLVVMRLLWRLLGGILEGLGYQRPGVGQRQAVGLVRDPVCGMFVMPSNALTLGTGANTKYFCSEKCRQAYGH
jgi:YHS domain-containing protein